MRKILCIFLIWLFVCSPVMAASTSDSQLDFDNDIMPLSTGSVVLDVGTYDYGSSTYTWLSEDNVVFDTPILENDPLFIAYYDSNYNSATPYLAIKVTLSDISLSKGQSMSLIFNRLIFYFGSEVIPLWKGFDPTTLAPVEMRVAFKWTGSGKHVNDAGTPSWISLNGTFNVPLDVSFQNPSVAYNSNGGSGRFFDGYPCADLTFNFTGDLPETAVVSGRTYEVVSGTITQAILYAVFPFDSSNLGLAPGSIPNGSSYNIGIVSSFAGGQPLYYLNYLHVPISSINTNFSSINQALGSLGKNIGNQFSDLKLTMQQGAQQVTDKLTEVKDGIVQGITDLKDTTTQGFKNVVQGITELPGKIGEMLQGLIVPDSDKVSDKFTDFKDLAESKLGVVYQVPEMMFDMANSIVSGAAEQKGEMTLPAFAIIMPDGQNLTVWEEYTFQIWPAGTEVIHTAVQTATSMICVIFTFNALKRKYEDWLDGK